MWLSSEINIAGLRLARRTRLSNVRRPCIRNSRIWSHIVSIDPTLSTPHAKWSCQKNAIRSWIGSSPVLTLDGCGTVAMRWTHQFVESFWDW